ncbi:MAG TPA: LysR family transcriptional regulator, partial [Verrucomicrobium sp.]|nr:LysR family transcriptional regulator [Verrucomicrobium sp.]
TVLAREGSFTQAGRALHLTQSAISHAIKALEEDLGCQLFLRQGKRVLLTHHGRELVRHADEIQRQMILARASLGALDQNPRGHLRIGSTPAASQFILPTVLREFKDSFPLYSISVVPGETPETLDRLEQGSLDLAVCLRPRDVSRVDCLPLFEDELVFLASPLHPWTRQAPRTKDLANETYIISSRNSTTFELIGDYFLKLGVRPRSFIELGNTEAIKELVKLGLGVALAAVWSAPSEIKTGSLVAIPLVRSRVKRQWVVTHMKQKPVSLAEQTFMNLCEQVGEQLGLRK